jgi:ABC-2 type transport system ATP-binding protein
MIEALNLTKRYRGDTRQALRDVSFEVPQGQIVGLLGHNGAGKSTVMGIMLGMVFPDEGEVRIGGISVQQERTRALRQIGAIFEAAVFYDYLTGWQNLRALCALSGWWDEREVARVLEMVNLVNAAKRKTGTYSHGMRQRLALAQALLPRPSVLLLDEPTDGLDPEGIREFRETVLRLKREWGMTILLNSHLLSEVEQMCDRCVILKEGRKVFDGVLASKSRGRRFELKTPSIREADAVANRLGAAINKKGSVELPAGVEGHEFLKALVEGGVQIDSWAPEKQSLEETYLELTGTRKA